MSGVEIHVYWFLSLKGVALITQMTTEGLQ